MFEIPFLLQEKIISSLQIFTSIPLFQKPETVIHRQYPECSWFLSQQYFLSQKGCFSEYLCLFLFSQTFVVMLSNYEKNKEREKYILA